jgi:hypothetical protein
MPQHSRESEVESHWFVELTAIQLLVQSSCVSCAQISYLDPDIFQQVQGIIISIRRHGTEF